MSARPGRRALLVVASAVVAAAVVAGFVVLGSPRDERGRRLDEVRVQDLMTLRGSVAEHFDRAGALPASLDALDPAVPKPYAVADPAGRGRYAYTVLDDSTFELCATFDHEREAGEARFTYDPWHHRAGPTCYRFRIGRMAGRDLRRELVPLREDEPAPPR